MLLSITDHYLVLMFTDDKPVKNKGDRPLFDIHVIAALETPISSPRFYRKILICF
jgi:hypothetical protein